MFVKARFNGADATGVSDCGIDGSEDDSGPRIKNEKIDIITSTYID